MGLHGNGYPRLWQPFLVLICMELHLLGMIFVVSVTTLLTNYVHDGSNLGLSIHSQEVMISSTNVFKNLTHLMSMFSNQQERVSISGIL